MQIPLDYYRILGVPVQADDDLIKSAYQDRVQQLPRREYSRYAITSRKNLLKKAYETLSNQSSRQDHDRQILTSDLTKNEPKIDPVDLQTTIEETEENTDNLELSQQEISPPMIDIEPDLFIGALMILLELGEYEIILKLSHGYLEGKEKLVDFTEKTEDLSLVWQDLILTVTLAYVELAREQWLQQEYELAGNSLTEAHSLLEKEQLLKDLKSEINIDLQRLKPYQIWQLLSDKNSEFKDRRKAINLLKQILDSRDGIEGKKSDSSGMSLDNFLKFIQQIRVYLTCAEQQELFEQEAKRPSPAANYLAAYALIARGFSEKKPQLIVRAKNILISLTVQQDVYLEQSICALLLGQTAEAEFSLSQSQEKETLKYIQEASQESPDLLPGLCLYTEKWLQTEIYPQFKDLSRESVSLTEYFDNNRVQEYLEKLSKPLVGSDDIEILEPVNHTSESEKVSSFTQFNELKEKSQQETPLFNDDDIKYDNVSETLEQLKPISVEKKSDFHLLVNDEQDFVDDEEEDLVNFSSFIEADLDSEISSNSDRSVNSSLAVRIKPRVERKSVSRDYSSSQTENPNIKTSVATEDKLTTAVPENSSTPPNFTFPTTTNTKNYERLIWLFLGLLLLTGLTFFLYKLFTKPKVSSLEIPISEPLITILEPREELVKPPVVVEEKSDIVNEQIALDVVRKWLDAKSKATGPEYDLKPLSEVLTGSLLSRWRSESYTLSNKNAYRRYEHTVAIESAEPDPENPDKGTAVARIREKSQYYSNGALNNSLSYEEELLVKYFLIKQKDNWLIQDVEVLKDK